MEYKEGDKIHTTMPPKIARKLSKRYTHLLNKMQRNKLHPFEEIEAIYSFMDYFNKHVNEPRVVCTKGCAYCCYVDVSLSPAEAAYISHHTGVEFDPGAQNRHYVKDTPCPFLNVEQGACTIYAYRPIVCRNYFTYDDPENCKSPYKVHLVSGVRNGFGNQTIMGLASGVYQMAKPVVELDVRQWFSHGLET